MMTADNFKALAAEGWAALTPQQKRMLMPYMQELCGLNGAAMTASTTGGGGDTPPGGSCDPAFAGRGNYVPWLNVPGCPVDCDPCAFPALDTDVRLFSWPEIDAQMWDTDTKINQLVSGVLPLTPGNEIVLVQEPRRTVTWIPECVQISTTWTGGAPQPGLLTYQWATGPKSPPFPTGQVVFANPQNGQQYEAGPTPSTSTTVIKLPFPTFKGCNSMGIGALSNLRLIARLDSAATASVQSMLVVCDHRKGGGKKANKCRGGCGGGSCSC